MRNFYQTQTPLLLYFNPFGIIKWNPNTKLSDKQKHFDPSHLIAQKTGEFRNFPRLVSSQGNYMTIKSSLNFNITKIWILHWEIQIRITFPGIKYTPRHFASQKSIEISPLTRLHSRVNILNKISKAYT